MRSSLSNQFAPYVHAAPWCGAAIDTHMWRFPEASEGASASIQPAGGLGPVSGDGAVEDAGATSWFRNRDARIEGWMLHPRSDPGAACRSITFMPQARAKRLSS
jgi:hypothetical protein